EIAQILMLRLPRRELQRAAATNPRWNRLVDERLHRRRSDHLQHVGGVFRAGSNVTGLKRFGVEDGHFTRSAYWDASRRLRVPDASASLSLIIQLACGSLLTCSGLSFSAVLTSTTSPAAGEYSSDTALTDSIVPNDCPALSFIPTSGKSMYTTSPSCCCAKSVMPTIPRSPAMSIHS